jgi:hypothetical protein
MTRSPKILKISAIYISPLTYICNKAISAVFPDRLKYSIVTPVFKKGNKSDPANYRPISVSVAYRGGWFGGFKPHLKYQITAVSRTPD